MTQVVDPVCGMTIEKETAAAESTYDGRTYYFCSADCKSTFDAEPSRFDKEVPLKSVSRADSLERHEPPHTKAGGMVAPKFGSAGSGGAEYERLPEKHDRD